MSEVPFMPKKGEPPFWLRDLTPEEQEKLRSMNEANARLKRDFDAIFGEKQEEKPK